MATTGRALGFYIKNWQQMEVLCGSTDKSGREALWGKKPKQEEMRNMVENVGKRADEQAAKFITRCGEEIIKQFGQLQCCNVKKRSWDSTIETDWEIEVRLWPKRAWKSASTRWTTGASIEGYDGSPVLLLWIWARGRHGRRDAEDDMARIFGKRVECRSEEVGWNPGTIVFGKIPLKDKVRGNFEMDGDQLTAQIRAILKKIRKKDVEKLFKI